MFACISQFLSLEKRKERNVFCENIQRLVSYVSLCVCLTIMVPHQEKIQFQPPPSSCQTLASYPKQISALFNQAATNQNID